MTTQASTLFLVFLACLLAPTRCLAETPEHAIWRFMRASAEQLDAAQAATDPRQKAELAANSLAYNLAACDEARLVPGVTAEANFRIGCSQTRAAVASVKSADARAMIERRAKEFRRSTVN